MWKDEISDYRGYLLVSRCVLGTGTNRTLRPDGTWRVSAPTWVEASIRQVVVGRRLPNGDVEELQVTGSVEEAQRWIEARLSVEG